MSSSSSSEEIKYAVLMETNGKEFESWYYFIRWNGNEDALRYLSKQLESIEFYILDDLSTFDRFRTSCFRTYSQRDDKT